MQVRHLGLATLFAVTGTAVAIGAAPIATADECNPESTVCQGTDVESDGSSLDFAPAAVDEPGYTPSEMDLTSAGNTAAGDPTEMGLTEESGSGR